MSYMPKQLYQTYIEKRDNLLRFFTARAKGNKELAEDIVQEIFLKISKLDENYKIENEMAFLFQIGNNIFLNHLRSHNRELARNNSYVEINSKKIGEDIIEQAPSVEEALELKGQILKVQQALKELPEREQAIFKYCKTDGRTQKEVAEILGLSKSTIEKSLAQTLRKLMQILNE